MHSGYPINFRHRVFKVVVAAASRVRLIAHHHSGPLVIRHRGRPRVGQEVDIDVVRVQQKGVVAGSANSLAAVLAARHPDWFDYLDTVGLGPTSAYVFHRYLFKIPLLGASMFLA